jgi:hypothetical protein
VEQTIVGFAKKRPWYGDRASEMGFLLGPIGQHILPDQLKITYFLQAHNSLL